MIGFSQFQMLESFKDAEIKFSKEYNERIVKDYIRQFKELRDKNVITGKERDIGFWMNKEFNDFKKIVDMKSNEYDIKKAYKEKSNDATLVFENDNVYIFLINSHEAAMKYGKGTKWCITESDGMNWNEYYYNYECTFYFVISKIEPPDNPWYKIAVTVYPSEDLEIYDAKDNLIKEEGEEGFDYICEEDGYSKDIFVPVKHESIYELIRNLPSNKEKAEFISKKWKSYNDKDLIWNETYTEVCFDKYANFEKFLDYNSLPQLEYAYNYFDNNEINYNYAIADVEESVFNHLDFNKIEKYIKENYPDEEVEDYDYFDFLKKQDDKLIFDCIDAFIDGVRIGTEKYCRKQIVSVLRDFNISGKIHDYTVSMNKNLDETPFYIKMSLDTMIEYISDSSNNYEITQNEMRYSVDSIDMKTDFDSDAAMEYIRNVTQEYL